ncbi:unnamed protein product [Clavelina lepadiformis]|uniref:LON peptidase N-terminal domain and RING finger protein 3 n=1 Tax=Clavelina lepadiformis TaxID=159417 RepID=A0ABP0G1E7_CLALP
MSEIHAMLDASNSLNIGADSALLLEKSVSVNIKEKLNLKSKLTADRQLLKTIVSPQRQSQKSKIKLELRSIVKEIAAKVTSSEINTEAHKVTAVIATLLGRSSSKIAASSKETSQGSSKVFTGSFPAMDDFSCQRCYELLYDPVTLPCGHTFCQSCLWISTMQNCVVCSKPLKQEELRLYRFNIVLVRILQKWHSVEYKGRSLTEKGINHLSKQNFGEAVKVLSEALSCVPGSHMALLHRAKAYYFLNLFDEALEDIFKVCQLAHAWPEAYYVKGEILYKLGCVEEALIAYFISLVLEPSKVCSRNKVRKILTQIIHHTEEREESDSKSLSPICRSPTNKKRSHGSCSTSPPYKLPCHLSTSSKDVVGLLGASDVFCEGVGSSNEVEEKTFKYLPHGYASELKIKSEDTCEMGSCLLHSHFPVDISYEEIRIKLEQEPVIDEKGQLIPVHLTPELESEIDRLLFNTESAVTRDLQTICNMSFNREVAVGGLLSISTTTLQRNVDQTLIDASDFECSLCMRLFYDPVCTPCGHIFCLLCIERCLDHNAQCPLCKRSMHHYMANAAESMEKLHPICDYVTKNIINQYLAVQLKERQQQHEEEIEELNQAQPIFVCTIAFPSVPCPLHIFEPRYRLMLRRCLEHNDKEFGMCMPVPGKPHHEVGTMLKVRDVTFFPDGRSVVDSAGFRRFRTSDCRVQDGYNVAKIKFIVDRKEADVDMIEQQMTVVYNDAVEWFTKLPVDTRTRIKSHFGDFPAQDNKINTENGPDWLWWVLAILPVEDRVKATILGNEDLLKRLGIFRKIFAILKRRNTER